MTDLRPDLQIDQELMRPRSMAAILPRGETPIVPKRSIAGRALVAVVAIMTFLASLTTGAVMLVRASAMEWQSDVAREVTIQVRPIEGKNLDAEVARAVEIAKRLSRRRRGPGLHQGGIRSSARAVARQRTCAGGSAGAAHDCGQAAVRRRVRPCAAEEIAWPTRLRARASTITAPGSIACAPWPATTVAGGIGLLILMLVATVLSVIFATRGAMATNRPIVEVLHFIGAKSGFIAGQFQRHFLLLGLEGGMIGGGLAMLLFGAAGIAAKLSAGTAGGDQLATLFGSFSLGWGGYLAIVGQIVLIALVTAFASRRTVNRTLETVE